LSNHQEGVRQPRSALQLGRFVLSVDGQRKSGFVDRVSADAAAAQLRTAFPGLNIVISDQEETIIRERTDEPG
jgi:hypothetical protein